MNDKIKNDVLFQLDSAIKSVEPYTSHTEEEKLVEEYIELIRIYCPTQMAALTFMTDYNIITTEQLQYICRERIVEVINDTVDVKAIRDKGYSWYSNKANGTWSHYKKYLLEKGFKPEDVDSVDTSTTRILCSVENPRINDKFSQKGLVIGNIQSGKTANFTGLISKFIDSKVDYIVVFTGIHNTLRNQTQLRIETDLIGRSQGRDGSYETVGIGKIFKNYHPNANMITNTFDDLKASDNRDLESEGTETTKIFIVKKNVSTLNTLKKMFSSITNKNKSMLIIDDEADNASIDTNANREDKDATATNASIRSLIQLFDRSFYIAYTATPYANIFINKDATTEKLDEDLFPKDFIQKLDVSTSYTGYEKYFNTAYSDQLVTKINDEIEYDKFEDALIDFMMGAALKKYMFEDGDQFVSFNQKHATMLIHISHLKNEHQNQKGYIQDLFAKLCTDILYFDGKEIKSALELSYDNARSAHMKIYGESFEVKFEHIFDKLKNMITKNEFVLNVNNSDAEEKLEYTDEFKTYIVIGGNTLSRGLTLEGLLVSYFGRISNTMDTMSQMARWFGYRADYLFMTKVYIPQIGINYFNQIATVDKLINEQLSEMHEFNQTPTEFTWMISKFGSLNPTSNAKLGGATRKAFSFSGDGPQITGLDVNKFESSKAIIEEFLNEFNIENLNDGFKVTNVASEELIKFLNEYKAINNDKRLYSVRTEIGSWVEYIEEKNKLINSELTNWTVVLKGKNKVENTENFSFGNLNFVNRNTQPIESSEPNLRRARIISAPQDESMDLDVSIDNRIEARKQRSEKNGLLIIYGVHDKITKKNTFTLAMSFPHTKVETDQEIDGFIN